MPAEFGSWASVRGRSRAWRDAGVSTALLEGLIAQGPSLARGLLRVDRVRLPHGRP